MASDKHFQQIELSKKVPKITIQNSKLKEKVDIDMPLSLPYRHVLDSGDKQVKVPDTHEMEFANNVPQFIKNEFGGYFLVHKGYKYIKNRAQNGAFADTWICEKGQKDEKTKCPGKVLINEFNQVEEKVAHANHKPQQGFAEMETFPTYKDLLSPENVKQLEEGKDLYHDGFTYRYRDNNSRNNKNKNKNRLYHVCDKISTQKCEGKATVEIGSTNLIFVTVQHNHKGEKFTSGIYFLFFGSIISITYPTSNSQSVMHDNHF
jgi:hypothetical protein